MLLKTVTLYKADGRIIVNARDKDTYLSDGYLPTKKEAMKQKTLAEEVIEEVVKDGEENEPATRV